MKKENLEVTVYADNGRHVSTVFPISSEKELEAVFYGNDEPLFVELYLDAKDHPKDHRRRSRVMIDFFPNGEVCGISLYDKDRKLMHWENT